MLSKPRDECFALSSPTPGRRSRFPSVVSATSVSACSCRMRLSRVANDEQWISKAMKTQSPSRPQRKTGKASGFRSARQFPWTKEEDALLGEFTDREVAGKLNRTIGAVRDRRK